MTYKVIQQKADQMAAWFAIALGISIPISVALDNVLMALLLVCWLAGDVPAKVRMIRNNPVALAGLGLYALLLLGSLHGDATLSQKTTLLVKYKGILLSVLLLPLFANERTRRLGLNGMTAAMILTFIMSFIVWMGWSPTLNTWFHVSPEVGATAFKGHIAQSFMMAVWAAMFGIIAQDSAGKRRLLFGLLAITCIFNILFMIYGRTGYVVAAVMAVYFFATAFRKTWQGILAGLVALGLLATATITLSHAFDQRIEAAVHEAEHYNPQQADQTSNGRRLEFYQNTLAIIKKHPFSGVGTGGFANAYKQQVAGTGKFAVDNPHDESLLITVQLGIIGLLALWFFYWQQLRQSFRLPDVTTRRMAQVLLLGLMVGGLMNSLLINHTESFFIAWLMAWVHARLGLPEVKNQQTVAHRVDKEVAFHGAPV